MLAGYTCSSPPPPSQGGLGVMDIESKVATMQGIHIGNIVSEKQTKWRVLAEYWCGTVLRGIIPFKNNVPHSDARPEFYNSVIRVYRKHRDDVPDWFKTKSKTLYPVILEARETKPKVERDHTGKDWATIWKRTLCTKLTNKQITLNFKIVHSVMPTGNRLRKYSQDPGTCPHCTQMETIKHLFTECSVVKPVGTWLNHSTVTADEDALIYSLFRSPPSKKIEATMVRALTIFRMSVWLARNKAKFDHKPTTPTALINKLKSKI